MNEVMYLIPQEILTATIEAMRDLESYYESDACALALDSEYGIVPERFDFELACC